MTKSFKIFFERRSRNPLRKKELEDSGVMSNKEWVEREKNNLPPEEQAKIDNMEKLSVPPELINRFKQGKYEEYENQLKRDYLRTKVEGKLLFNLYGVKVYVDQYIDQDFSKHSLNWRMIKHGISYLIRQYKDILPNRKPTVVITNTKKHPLLKHANITGSKTSPPGAYRDRIIYIDQFSVDDYGILIHEYAHFLSDRLPKQIEPLLQNEYSKMLDAFFEKKTKRKNLEGRRNANMRKMVAQKMGLPSDYAASNFNEWFAELIANWKNMPNDVASYRFKSILKKIIIRL